MKKNNRKSRLSFKNLIIGGVFLLSILVSSGYVFSDKLFEISKNIEIFVKVYKELNTKYVDNLDPSELMRTGIDAMVSSLDPYTNYISEAEVESYRLQEDETYKGIGAEIDLVDGILTILAPYDGSPALNAGLKAGDQIIMVNGLSTEGKSLEDLDRVIRGVPGTGVKLVIQRPAENTLFPITIVRSETNRDNVPYYGMVKDGVGYVILTTFTNNSAKNIESAIRDLKKVHGPLKGMILDLRDNGGGLLREAIFVSNLFIENGELVVTTKGKSIEDDKVYRTSNTPLDLDIPLAVLINDRSASASEIVAGVIQDLDRGILVGQRSFGKGLVQNVENIAYNNRLKITISKYYIPSGRCIQSAEYANGLPVNIPDERRAIFKTRNGRDVLDGGGVAPDIVMEVPSESPLMYALKKDHMIFKFVNEYITEMDSLKNTDYYTFKDFHRFENYLKTHGFEFTTETEILLSDIADVISEEFPDTGLEALCFPLKEAVEKEKNAALSKEKESIIEEIEKEIISRFFLQSGRIKFSLSKDPDVLVAMEVLLNKDIYHRIRGVK
ncbi:MAG TPA: S41 family peptidase [Saprospiraceae bacterium]|nr:S41 family peptidase [Saprospiraceae bacterium]